MLTRFAALALLLAACGCSRSSAASSPSEAFDRAKACRVSGDWAGFYDLIAPAKRDAAIGSLIYFAAFAGLGSETASAEYKRLMQSHGLDPEPPALDVSAAPGAQLSQWLASAKDRRKLFADLMALTRDRRKTDDKILNASAVLSDVRVTGDAATGTLTTPDGKKKTMAFARVEGRWYLDE